jgi:hypothetical protein
LFSDEKEENDLLIFAAGVIARNKGSLLAFTAGKC